MAMPRRDAKLPLRGKLGTVPDLVQDLRNHRWSEDNDNIEIALAV
jgi:hypothetical protein